MNEIQFSPKRKSFDLTAGLADLEQLSDLADLHLWWQIHISSQLAHDCAVVGEAENSGAELRVSGILMHLGEFRDNASVLLSRCSALLAAWSLMKQPCVINLGACECVGDSIHPRQSATATRSFLIHGIQHQDKIVFILLSSWGGWSCEMDAKQFASDLANPIAEASRRIEPRQMSWPANNGSEPKKHLTSRELDIVSALSRGCTNKEIARCLGTSPNTVRNQLARLSEKVGARSRAQLALLTSTRVQLENDESTAIDPRPIYSKNQFRFGKESGSSIA